MVDNIKKSLALKLKELYPLSTVYVEDIPQNFKKPSFLISLINMSYEKRLAGKYDVEFNFEIAYFSAKANIKADCAAVQVQLFRELNLTDYRLQNKEADITDSVLTYKFKIKLSELKSIEYVKMLTETNNTNLK